MSKYLTISHPLGTETPASPSTLKQVTIIGNFSGVKVKNVGGKVIETIEFNDDGQEAVVSTYATNISEPVEFTMHNVTPQSPDFYLMNFAYTTQFIKGDTAITVREYSATDKPAPFVRIAVNYNDYVWVITNPKDFASKPTTELQACQVALLAPKAKVTFE